MHRQEGRFLVDMASPARGRIPMGWGTESVLRKKMIVQVGRSDH